MGGRRLRHTRHSLPTSSAPAAYPTPCCPLQDARRRARSRRSGILQLKAKRATLAMPPSSPPSRSLSGGERSRVPSLAGPTATFASSLRGPRAWKPEGHTDQTLYRCQRHKRWPDARTACQIGCSFHTSLHQAPRVTGERGARERQHRLWRVEHERQVVLRTPHAAARCGCAGGRREGDPEGGHREEDAPSQGRA